MLPLTPSSAILKCINADRARLGIAYGEGVGAGGAGDLNAVVIRAGAGIYGSSAAYLSIVVCHGKNVVTVEAGDRGRSVDRGSTGDGRSAAAYSNAIAVGGIGKPYAGCVNDEPVADA
jgi:hypothetical protein